MCVTGALAVTFFLASAFTPLPNILGYWTSIPGDPRPVDAIVVLGSGGPTPPGILGGPSLRKAVYGIRLYRRGLAPLLVLSGAGDEDGQRGESSFRVELAREYGVPEQAILADTNPRIADEPTTYGEALRYRKALKERGVRRVLLVTDSQHMRRALRVFERAGFSASAAPIDEISLDTSSPEERLRLMRWIGEEWIARLHYVAAGYM
jgi:uncharacterized SAM-binding protein YcdF (DUF218 family)